MPDPIQNSSSQTPTFDPAEELCSVEPNQSSVEQSATRAAPPVTAGTAQLLENYAGDSAAFAQAQGGPAECADQVMTAVAECALAAGASAGVFATAASPMSAPLAFAVGLGVGARILGCTQAVADAANACDGGS